MKKDVRVRVLDGEHKNRTGTANTPTHEAMAAAVEFCGLGPRSGVPVQLDAEGGQPDGRGGRGGETVWFHEHELEPIETPI